MQETTFPSLYVSFHPIICLYVFLLAFYLSIMISWLYWQTFLCPFCLPLYKGLLRLTQIMGIPLRRLVIIMCCRWTRIHLTFRYVLEHGKSTQTFFHLSGILGLTLSRKVIMHADKTIIYQVHWTVYMHIFTGRYWKTDGFRKCWQSRGRFGGSRSGGCMWKGWSVDTQLGTLTLNCQVISILMKGVSF